MYKPSLQIVHSISLLRSGLTFYNFRHENLTIIKDFNMPSFKHFKKIFDILCLITRPTYHQFKITTGISLILTNKKNHFSLSDTFENDLFDNHMLISTSIKSIIFKGPPKKKNM